MIIKDIITAAEVSRRQGLKIQELENRVKELETPLAVPPVFFWLTLAMAIFCALYTWLN